MRKDGYDMNTIKCPFQPKYDQEIPLGIVFDTFSVGNEVAEKTAGFIIWLLSCNNKEAVNRVYSILKANLGEERLSLFTNMYLKTYNKEKKKVLRYHPVDSEDKIKDIFYIFRTINNLMPTFKEMAAYYNKIAQRKDYEQYSETNRQ